MTLEEAKYQLEEIYVAKRSSLPFKGIAAAIIATSLYLQGGRLVDIITAVLAGTIGYLVVEILDRKLRNRYYFCNWTCICS